MRFSIFSTPVLLGLSLLTLSGCTTLTPGGKNIEVVEDVAPSCRMLKQISAKNASVYGMINLRNMTARLGGTDLIAPKGGSARIFKCSDVTELGEECEMKNNAPACYEYGQYLNDDELDGKEESYKYFSFGCKLKHRSSCAEAGRLGKQIEAENNCRIKNDATACLEIMSLRYQRQDLDNAIIYSQLACIKGNQMGCSLHRDLVAEKNEGKRAIATENAAQIQADTMQEIEAQRIDEEKRQAFGRALQNSFSKPKTTNCTKFGNQVNCTSY